MTDKTVAVQIAQWNKCIQEVRKILKSVPEGATFKDDYFPESFMGKTT